MFPGLFLGDFDDQGQFIRRFNQIGEEAKRMDSKRVVP